MAKTVRQNQCLLMEKGISSSGRPISAAAFKGKAFWGHDTFTKPLLVQENEYFKLLVASNLSQKIKFHKWSLYPSEWLLRSRWSLHFLEWRLLVRSSTSLPFYLDVKEPLGKILNPKLTPIVFLTFKSPWVKNFAKWLSC